MRLTSLIRYGLVSGTCLVAHNAIMVACDALGGSIYVGIAFSFGSIVCVGYALHSRFTFMTAMSWPSFLRYVLMMSANLPLSIVSLWITSRAMGLAMWLAAPLAACSAMAANFIFSRWAMAPRTRPLLGKELAW